MVNEVILKYFKDNVPKFSKGVLRARLLSSGYNGVEIDEVIKFLDDGLSTPGKKGMLPIKNNLASEGVTSVRVMKKGLSSMKTHGPSMGSGFMKTSSFIGFFFILAIFLYFGFKIFQVEIPRMVDFGILAIVLILIPIYIYGISRLGSSISSKRIRKSSLVIISSYILLIGVAVAGFFVALDKLLLGIFDPIFTGGNISLDLISIAFYSIFMTILLIILISKYVLALDLSNYESSVRFSKYSSIFILVWCIFTTSILIAMGYSLFDYPALFNFLTDLRRGYVILASGVIYGAVFVMKIFLESLMLYSASHKFSVKLK